MLVCTSVTELEVNVICSYQVLFFLLFEIRPLAEPGAIGSGRLAGHTTPEIKPDSASPVQGLQAQPPRSALT